MPELMIYYLVGTVVVLFACCYSSRNDDITLGDVTKTVILGLFSWITILFVVLYVINNLLEYLLTSGKLIYRRKRTLNGSVKTGKEDIPLQSCSFSVGDRIRLKGNDGDHVGFLIVEIREGIYWCDSDITIPCSRQHLFEKF